MIPNLHAQSSCGTPTGTKVAQVLSTKIALTWHADNTANGHKMRVAFAQYPGNNFVIRDFVSGTSGELTGLKPNTRYLIRVSRLCASQQSATLSLGYIRTLSKAEELVICDPAAEGDLCEILKQITTGERGKNHIDIKFPKPPAELLQQYPNHNITIRFSPVDANGNTGTWNTATTTYATLVNDQYRLGNLTENTLYALEVKWEVLNSTGSVIKTCNVLLNSTPTYGDNYIGPIFQQLPADITLDCSTPLPLELLPPELNGGCAGLRLNFTDEALGSGCNKQIRRTWLATDDCGRHSSVTQMISFVDHQPPVFADVPPNNAVVECSDNLPNEKPIAVDNCSAVTLSSTDEVQGSGCTRSIHRIWTATDACGNTATYVQTIQVRLDTEESDGEDPIVPPLPLNCGQTYTQQPNTNFNMLNTAQIGDVFNMAGFPTKLQQVSGSNGFFSGKAKVRLPFGNKVVYVDFSNIQVNTDKRIIAGSLIALPDPNFEMPTGGNVNFGGDICIPDPPLVNPGFNENGDYTKAPPYDDWKPNDPIDPRYDPNGFDANGIHKDNGTKYNEDGCSQEGLDKDGNPCNPGKKGPYYWLHNNGNNNAPTTPEGIAYAKELQTSTTIRDKVVTAINTLLTENTTKINNKRTECNGIRTVLNTKAAGLDRAFIFGANDEFFNEDMSLRFSSTPQLLKVNVPDRKQQIVEVETKHIDLYYCDKILYKFKKIDQILTGFKKPTELDILVNNILDNVTKLTAEKVAELKGDPAKLAAWLKEEVERALQRELQLAGLAVLDQPAMPDYLERGNLDFLPTFDAHNAPGRPSPSGYLAAVDGPEMFALALKSTLNTPDDLEFEFNQGFEYVGGVHRAFYLDAIAQARDKKKGLGPENGDDPESLLPIRIEKEVGGRTYTILLDKITFTTTGGTLDAFFILDIPNSDQRLIFRATNVAFTPGGLASSGTTLKLESDVSIRLNNVSKLIIKGNSGDTWVKFNCEGFAGMSIDGGVEFCRNYFVPLNPVTMQVIPDETVRVRANFKAQMPAWGEFIATISMDPFALADHQDYKFVVQGASLDFSDVSNPDQFVDISANYTSEFKNGHSFSPQWKGFFMQRLEVTIPPQFKTNNQQPIKISAKNLIIDDRGLTGLFGLKYPVIPLEQGNLDGWAFSMDSFGLAVVANKVRGGGFGGLIHVPIFSNGAGGSQITAADCFKYEAKIMATPAGELYEFAVKPATDSLTADIWKAKVMLTPTSSLRVSYLNNKFVINANLTGSLNINGTMESSTKFTLPSMTFQNVQLSNQAPYFGGGTFSLGGNVGAKFGGFALVVQLPSMASGASPGTCAFNVAAKITLVGSNDDNTNKFNITAATGVALNGEMELIGGRQRWKYKDYNIKEIYLDASWKGVEGIKGSIKWYKHHPVFGKGFRGRVSVQFSGLKKLGDLGVEAVAQFGSKDTYKYFMVDAFVKLGYGVELGGLALKAFGGGAYYHMNRDSSAFKSLDQANSSPVIPDQLGESISGIIYTPDNAIGLGLKAMVVMATSGNEEVFNAGLTFEIRFITGGGIKDIALYGSARIMAPIQFGTSALYGNQPTEQAPVSAKVAILFAFDTKTLHGELDVYANVYDVFKGAQPGNLVGKAVIHFDPQKWYINIGTPIQPMGWSMSIPLGNASVDLLTVQSYICIGTGLPPMPPLPAYVREMTGAGSFMANESRRASGKGFAFGASMALSTGELKFLIFYGKLEAGLGFDVMLQKYEGLICANNNNKPIGINGWYASGQAWAYLDAEVGLKFKSKRYTILKIGAAAALQMKLPNPFWARGAVGGKYKLLGGLIKGNCNFKFTLGKNCEGEGVDGGDGLQYVKLIEDLSPADKADEVEVNTKPTAYFGVPVNNSFSVSDDEGTETVYNTTLTKIELRDPTGRLIPCKLKLSSDSRQMTYHTASFLDSRTEYTFTAEVVCKKGNVVERTETKTIKFKTGDAFTNIPKSNVAASYPMDGMYNLYRKETNKGYIRLHDGQPDLLNDYAGIKIFISNKSGVVSQQEPKILGYGSELQFDIPADLAQNVFYRLDVLIPAKITETVVNDGGTANRMAGGSAPLKIKEEDQILHTLYFRTSVFERFSDKIMQFVSQSTATKNNYEMLRTANLEPFDRIEMDGSADLPPLVNVQCSTNDYVEKMQGLYFMLENQAGYAPNHRSVGNTIFPHDFMNLYVNGSPVLPRADITQFETQTQGMTNTVVMMVNNIVGVVYSDFYNYREQAFNKMSNECVEFFNNSNPITCDPLPNNAYYCCGSTPYNIMYENPPLKEIYAYPEETCKPLTGTTHPVWISYKLPGGENTTPGVKLNFNFD